MWDSRKTVNFCVGACVFFAAIFVITRPAEESGSDVDGLPIEHSTSNSNDAPYPVLASNVELKQQVPKIEGAETRDPSPEISSRLVSKLQAGLVDQGDVIDWLLWSSTLVSNDGQDYGTVSLDLEGSSNWVTGYIQKHPQSGNRGPRLEWNMKGHFILAPSYKDTPIRLQVVIGFEDTTHRRLDLVNVIVQQDFPYTHEWRDILASEQVTGANTSWKAGSSTWYAIYSSASETSEGTEFAQRFGDPQSSDYQQKHLPGHVVLADLSGSL